MFTYKFRLVSPRHIDRVGTLLTGKVRVAKEMTNDEVETFIKQELFHGIVNDACLEQLSIVGC